MESSTTETSGDECLIGTKVKPFVCSYNDCKASFSKSRKLTNHTRRHTGERPFVCDEPNCTKTYTNSSHLRRHKKVFHLKQNERVTCTVKGCFMELANNTSLKNHLNRFHNKDRKYAFHCKDCNQGFHRKRQLQHHSYLHTGELPFKCDKCDGKFATIRDCNRHKRTHTTYSCECGSTFERWTVLLAHRKLCERKSFKCSVCDKSFAQATNFTTHLRTHELKDDRDVFVCPYKKCVRFYFYKKNLTYHINRIHKKLPKPKIPCEYPGCDKRLSKMQNYKLHLKLHSEPRKRKLNRKPRKDKGRVKKSVISKLSGITLPLKNNKSDAHDHVELTHVIFSLKLMMFLFMRKILIDV